MPIAFAPSDKELEIKRVSADDKIKKRLQELGITVGGKITLVSSSGGGVIVVVKECRLFLFILYTTPSPRDRG